MKSPILLLVLLTAIPAPVSAINETPDTPATLPADCAEAFAADLTFLLEEERMLGDLCAELAVQWRLPLLQSIQFAERNHESEVRELADRYDLTVPRTVEHGDYASAVLRETYQQQLAAGSRSTRAALLAARQAIERCLTDVRALAVKYPAIPDALALFTSLDTGSQRNLARIDRELAKLESS